MDIEPKIEGNVFSKYSDEELQKKLDDLPKIVEGFKQLKAELERRGLGSENPNPNVSVPNNPFTESPHVLNTPAAAKPLTYSIAGSLVWEILFLLIALVGAYFFAAKMLDVEDELGFKSIATIVVGVLAVASIGAIAGAVRRLANMKGNVSSKATTGTPGYLILMSGWFICFAACIYYAIKLFTGVVEYSFKYALLGALIPLLIALFCSAFFAIFYVVNKEVKS